MKIFVFTNFDMGLYKFRKELLIQLIKDNEVTLFLPVGEFYDDLVGLGCKYVPFEFNRRGMNPFSDLNQLIRYLKILRREKPDVVLTYTIKPNVYGGLACRLTKTPYLANVTGLGTSIENGGIIGKLSIALYKLGLKAAKCVFFQNKNNLQLFEKKGIVKKATRLIPGSGVNITDHCFEEYPKDDSEWRFLFIGRIMRDKGINELLDATKLVHTQYPNIHLDIVGGCDEDYEDVLTETEQAGYITYHGQQRDVHGFIINSHCTVLPSYHEGTANVLLESASTGRPVIATRVPGCHETYDEGITGLGCDVKSAESLAEAMIKFIELPYEEKVQMGIAGRKKIEREFDRQIVIDAYMEEIKKINESRVQK